MKKQLKRNKFITKTVSSLKKDIINSKNKEKKIIINMNDKKYNNLNNINNNKNNSETLEKIIKEEVEKVKIPTFKRENLKNIYLLENNNIPNLYDWNTLFNNSIPVYKYVSSAKKGIMNNNYNKSEIIKNDENKLNLNKNNISNTITNNQNTIKPRYKSFKKRNKSQIFFHNKIIKNSSETNYNKGINVISKISNESLQNYYEEIIKKRQFSPALGPRMKLNNNKLKQEIKSQRILTFRKEKKLNLISNENENDEDNIKNEDLIIAAKRKNADILMKTFYEKELELINEERKKSKNIDRNKFRKEMIKIRKNNNHNNNKKDNEKKRGLILSFYNENNPYIKIFENAAKNLNEKNEKKIKNKNKIEITEDDIIKPTLKKNFFLSKNIFNEERNKFNNKNDYDYNESNNINENSRKSIQLIKNFFNNIENSKNDKIYSLKHSKSSTKLKFKNKKKYGFYNSIKKLKENILEKENIINDFDTISYIQSLPKRSSSKVGNPVYDKINKILKYKFNKKRTKLKNKNNKNKPIKLSSKTVNNNFEFFEEENKDDKDNNKRLSKFLLENLEKNGNNNILSNGYTKNVNYYFFGDDYKYENIKNKIKIYDDENILKNISKQFYLYPLKIHNKIGNNFYSCSNNYIVSNKRRNKNRILSNYSNNISFNEFISEILSEENDKIQGESFDKIKSIYN